MVGEIANFVAKHKAKLFPSDGSSKKTSKSERPGSVGDLGKSLKDNDPETLKFIGRHKTTIFGDKPEVATTHCLDDPINSHMKPKEGVYEDNWIKGAIKHPGAEKRAAKRAGMSTQEYMHKHEHDKGKSGDRARLGIRLSHMHHEEVEEMEEEAKCPKCGAKNCSCGHTECGKKLKTAKLKEETLCNLIALDILEDMKAYRLEEGSGLGSVHKVSPGDPDYTGGMHIGLKPKAEVATEHKPAVASTEKSKKLRRKEVKEGHKEPMPHLDNPSHGSGCTGHEDPMIHVKKPQSDPTKIPNMNKFTNSTQPPHGVLDKRKKKISEGFGRVSDPQLRKQAIGKANKLDAPPVTPLPKTGTSKTDLMTSLTAIRKKQMEETELEEDGKEKVEKTMHEFKHGTLHSGSKTGPKVKSRKQAIAIALSQQRKADGK